MKHSSFEISMKFPHLEDDAPQTIIVDGSKSGTYHIEMITEMSRARVDLDLEQLQEIRAVINQVIFKIEGDI